MVNESLNRSGDFSADQVVSALLDDVNVKSFVEKIPCAIHEAVQALEERFFREYKQKKLVSADHAEDKAVELISEVCNDFVIDPAGPEFDVLLHRAIRLSQNVRPLFT